jgi:glycine/D-amino acid oxidase-like deaminating enzyme
VIDVVVVGAGVFGLSVGLELTRRGRSVTFVSAGAPGRAGASAAQTRIARLAYGSDDVLSQSALDGLAGWKQIERLCGTRLFMPTGVLHLLSSTGAARWEHDSAATLATLGSSTRELDPDDLARLWPALSTEGLAGGLLERDGGVLLAQAATVALHRVASGQGAKTVIGTATPTHAGVEVDGERVDADTVVWAVGAGLPGQFPAMGGVEALTHDSYFLDHGDDSLRSMPPWLDRDVPAYGVTEPSGALKFALDVDRAPDEPAATGLPDVARRYLDTRFPEATLRAVGHQACSYAATDDGDFAVGLAPDDARHWIVSGDSGHGFKHAPAWGRYAARVIQGETGPDARFSLARLGEAPVGIA